MSCPSFFNLLTIDLKVMSRTTEDRRTGTQWEFTSVLQELDFADDIALLSVRYVEIRDNPRRPVDEVAKVGLKISAKKLKSHE